MSLQQNNAILRAGVKKPVSQSVKDKGNENRPLTEKEIIEKAMNKPHASVNVQRSMDLLAQREADEINQSTHKEKIYPYKMMRLMMGIYALAMAATIYHGLMNVEQTKEFRNTPAVVGLALTMGLLGYEMRRTKNELIADQTKRMHRLNWGFQPTPAAAWAAIKGQTR